jgi:tetratricopeptide (TPR) repeat protein
VAVKPPSTIFGKVQKFFGATASSAAGYAAGLATAPTLAPELQDLVNEAWQLHSSRVPDAGTLANGVAQRQIDHDLAATWASYHGINRQRFDALVNIANTGPGIPPAFDLWRRGIIDQAGFRKAAGRQGLEQEWIDALVGLFHDVLDSAQLANAIHRNLIPDPGLLQGEKPGPDRTVPAYPIYDIDALAEALANGYDREHLGVLVGLAGLPMGAHEAAQAYFRHKITRDDYLAAIAQGNTRNEWAAAILEQSRQIPTARDFLENALRGYRTLGEAIAGAELHGMTEEHATLIYQNQGRPMNVRQITQALARGGAFHPEPGEIADPYDAAIVEGNLKPAYYDLAKALRYTMPSTFAIRTLAQSGVWNFTTTRDRLLWSGWNPQDADDVARAWTTTKSGTAKEATAADLLTLYDARRRTREETLADLEALGYPADEAATKLDVLDARRVVSAKTSAIGDLHTSYKKGGLTNEAVAAALAELGVAGWAVPEVVAAWQAFLTAEGASPPA